MKQGWLEEAETVILAWLRLYPDDAMGFEYLCGVLDQQERWAAAEIPCRVAAFLHANSTASQGNLGEVLGKLGNFAEAEEHIRMAIGRDPERQWLWFALGTVLMKQSRWAEAEQVFEEANALGPVKKRTVQVVF